MAQTFCAPSSIKNFWIVGSEPSIEGPARLEKSADGLDDPAIFADIPKFWIMGDAPGAEAGFERVSKRIGNHGNPRREHDTVHDKPKHVRFEP
jgi:hypothetical protein